MFFNTDNNTIKIGFLNPHSSYYPYYAQHLLTGFFLGMGKDPGSQKEIQFVPHYTDTGSSSKTKEGVKKLLNFDRVDMISGLISYSVLPEIVPLLESREKLGFFFDSGEYIPYFDYLSPNTFFSSNQLWQSEYALGQWARKEYGEGGLIVMPLLESGYHLHSAFQTGFTMGGGGQILLSVLPFDQQNPHNLDMDKVFREIKKKAPPFVHAIFTGDGGTEFFKRWVDEGLNKQIPLIVAENMIYDEWLQDVAGLDIECYSSLLYDPAKSSMQNRMFKNQFQQTTGQQVNIFALLGYEGGLAFKELYGELKKRNWAKVKSLLQTEHIKGPRGERNFYPDSGFVLPEVNISKVKVGRAKVDKQVIGQGKRLAYNNLIFDDIRKSIPSGWQNPLFCV
ncbi:ABC transporter substrate-binding protein [Gracilimonas mengyeensis]|uniref:Amino acid/amide ABC transporter substrate-binding protein, HAAT family n=1 Tax=Gracilimonas mengyeensis TaxID=1302730 RepID=A0A521CL75_9BACT|nr:ABC transporter substrate-binding protein [Gracilimonas mengyeensis]SMO60178.1 amino acid/amide ABC transporter substrate-binding protein, HAAT family [Gracilimonas mengyeensis]